MTSANASSRHVEREDVLLWLFAFVPVLAWIVAQSVSFLATRSICATGHRWLLYLVMGTSLAAAMAAGAFSWTNWTRWRGLATYRRFMAESDPDRKNDAGKDLIRAIFGKDALAEDSIL